MSASSLAVATPSPSPTDVVGETTGAAIDILAIAAGVGAGILLGLALSVVLQLLFKASLRKRKVLSEAVNRTMTPLRFFLAALGGWFGLEFATQTNAPTWKDPASHTLLVCCILAATWLVASFVTGLKDVTLSRIKASGISRYRRVQTQMQILNRVVTAGIWIIGLAAVLLTFNMARTAGASLFASAGLISVVAGIAAQSTLGNVFAGLQLAFSDSIRMGDIVIWNTEYAKVEDITLTYVVLKIWDGRRLIVPSTQLTSQTFENWTRQDTGMLGYVDFVVDWSVPIPAMRKELERMLKATDLWNGETGIVQVRATEGTEVKVSALVSAATPSALIDLQYYVREHMLRWIQSEYPDIVPHGRNYFTPPDPLQGGKGIRAAADAGAAVPEGMEDAADVAAERQREAREVAPAVSGKHPISSVSKDIAAEWREVRERRAAVPSWRRGKKSLAPTTRETALERHAARIEREVKETLRRVSGTEVGQDVGATSASVGVAGGGSAAVAPASQVNATPERNDAPGAAAQSPTHGGGHPAGAPVRTPAFEREPSMETGHESSIFTGSIAALKRAEEFSGPGEEAIREREAAVRRKEEEAERCEGSEEQSREKESKDRTKEAKPGASGRGGGDAKTAQAASGDGGKTGRAALSGGAPTELMTVGDIRASVEESTNNGQASGR